MTVEIFLTDGQKIELKEDDTLIGGADGIGGNGQNVEKFYTIPKQSIFLIRSDKKI